MNLKIGYVRVSKWGQNFDLQVDALEKAGVEKENIVTDKISGSVEKRSGLEDVLKRLRKGDTLIVWRLDRLGRSLKHLIQIVEDIENSGINFVSIKDGIDTSTPIGKLLFQINGAYAEYERNIIRERVNAGLEAARARGRIGGKKRKLSKAKAELVKKLYNEKKHQVQELCEMFDITKPTLYSYVRGKHERKPNNQNEDERD